MRLLFLVWFLSFASISVAGPVSQLLCGCPYACSTYTPAFFTCSASVPFEYVQKIPYSCEENHQFCVLEAYSAILYNDAYSKQQIRIHGPNSLYCYRSIFKCWSGPINTFITGFTPDGTGGCVLADLPDPDQECSTIGVYLEEVVPTTDSLVVESVLPVAGAFRIVPTLTGLYSSFFPIPLSQCCTDLPPDIYVESPCSTVLFSPASGSYVATDFFDPACASTSEPVSQGTQYWFDVHVLGYALPPCDGNRINATLLNFTQIMPPTAAPTLFPTVDPARLRLVPVSSRSERDASLCPVTVSGFGKPRFSTVAATDLTPRFDSASIWFPPDLYVVSAAGLEFNVTSSACVAQNEGCRAFWNADVSVTATEGTVSYGSSAQTDGSLNCNPRAQCYVGEAQNLNHERLVFLDVRWPDSLDEYAIFDMNVAVYGDEFVTFDTARITYETMDGIVSYDVSSGYKAVVMQNVSYPEYSQGLFCRYNDTLFFQPPRVNGWTAANLGALNSTLCAFVGDPAVDRVMVVPSGVAYASTYQSVTIEGFAQIRANGTFVGCVYAAKTITPIQPARVVALPASIIVAAVMGSTAVCALLLIVRAAVQAVLRRRKKEDRKKS